MTEPFFRLLDAANSVTDKVDGWEVFGRVADVAGFISVLVSIPTYFIAKGTKKAIAAHDEQKEYELNIDENIERLQAIYTGIVVDEYYNEKVIENIIKEIDCLKIEYPNVIKQYIKDINKLKKNCIDTSPHITDTNHYNKKTVTRQLNIVITELKKGKQLL